MMQGFETAVRWRFTLAYVVFTCGRLRAEQELVKKYGAELYCGRPIVSLNAADRYGSSGGFVKSVGDLRLFGDSI